MVLQCSFVKQALLAAGLLLSLAHGARRGPQQPAAAISPGAAPAVGRHENHPLAQHLRAGSTAPVARTGDVPAAGLAAVPKASNFVAKRQDPDHPEESERIMDGITRMKVETCVDLKEAHGKDFGQFESCLDLLTDVCHPGKDGKMDGDGGESPTGEGFCKAYFDKAKKVTEESAKKCVKAVKEGTDSEEYKTCLPFMQKLCEPGEDKMMDGGKKETPTGEGYCQKFFPKKDEEKKEPEKVQKGNSSSEGEDGGKNTTNTSTGVKDSGNSSKGDNEGDGVPGEKHAAGWHMKETEKVPAQGFEGKKVAHDDQETITDDWRKEYGPEHPSYSEVDEICKNNPSNKWCEHLMSHREMQKQKRHPRSGAAKVRSPALALALAALLRAAA